MKRRKLVRFLFSVTMTALICITSPTLSQIATASLPNLEEQARTQYSNQKYSEAAQLFQQAAQNYKTASDPIRQSLSLSNLSLSYQQLGQWDKAEQAIVQSLSVLKATPEKTPGRSIAIAQSLDIQGSLQLARGKTNAALETWKQATEIYQKEGKRDRALVSQTNQAQALQNLGLYRRAIETLDQALSLKARENPTTLKIALQKATSTPETATALRTLGESLRVVGDFLQAKLVLERGLAIATELKLTDTIALTQLSLGNTFRAQGFGTPKPAETDFQTALTYYQQAASRPGNLRVQSQLNQLSLLIDRQQSILSDTQRAESQKQAAARKITAAAEQLLPQIQTEIEALPPSKSAIEARINLAQTMMQMKQNPRSIATSLAIAVQHSEALGDPRTQSYALGSLGSIYEQTKQLPEAEKLTNRALELAQQINAGDIAYRWQWQLGRVLTAQENRSEDAILAYQQAVSTIKSLREDLAASSPDVQFSFRVAIEPIHRQLVSLLLKSKQKNRLQTARKVIEDLQLVELDNFFREACLTVNEKQIDKVAQDAAIIYPILLDDRISLILSLPGEKETDEPIQIYHETKVSQKEVETLILKLRDGLDGRNTLETTLPRLQTVYNWLIAPIKADLAKRNVKTLVFVPDGALRAIPMSALHDGTQFLIEQYSVAITPGLQLLSPKPLNTERLNALVAGLTEARSNFQALPAVKTEVRAIQKELPSEVLLDSTFTTEKFENRLSQASFPIVHLATHGRFGSRKEDTYILTSDGQINITDLSSVLQTIDLSKQRSLELLVLSACETAQGDPQSVLGLAGIAVQSGARSTVATLWRVNDEASAKLMEVFYAELAKINQTGISKAEALRRAQLAILKDPTYEQQPFFWAPYILIGNWT
ncbi:MAG: CHAT domain-containing protein [Leptolyngbya sp. Prado105]|jgi:CHAT domain-containing protein|nr:CHAT domain-containing protein [Leptolyngbya sp. Prado105]